MSFEPLQGKADSRLLDIEPPGCGPDAPGARNLAENLEQIQIDALEQRGIDPGGLLGHGRYPGPGS